MTAATVLAEARAAGVALYRDGERLRASPADRLTPGLRARLADVKPEILQLLAARQHVATRMWSEAFLRLCGCGWPGRSTLAGLRPDLLQTIDDAEATAETAADAFCNAETGPEPYGDALGAWEALIREAGRILGAFCYDCGRPVPVAMADPITGERFCASCVQLPTRGTR
jgi:hypothetical protein